MMTRSAPGQIRCSSAAQHGDIAVQGKAHTLVLPPALNLCLSGIQGIEISGLLLPSEEQMDEEPRETQPFLRCST
jgi:hypothetical protein